MANAKKTIVIIGLVGLLSAGAYFGIKSTKLSHAVDKLDYDIDAFTLKSVKKNPLGIPTSLIYTVSLKLNNPTDQDLVITKPYFTLSVKKADGSLAKVFNTDTPDNITTNIKSKASTIVKHDIELRLLNVVPVIPNLIQYVLSRVSGTKSTQQVVIDVLLDSSGITFPIQKIVNL